MKKGKRLLALVLAVILSMPDVSAVTALAAETSFTEEVAGEAVDTAAEAGDEVSEGITDETSYVTDDAPEQTSSAEAADAADEGVSEISDQVKDEKDSSEDENLNGKAALVTKLSVDPQLLLEALNGNYKYDASADAFVVSYINAFDQKDYIQTAIRTYRNDDSVIKISVDGTDLNSKANSLYIRKLNEITFTWSDGTGEFAGAGDYTLKVTLPAAEGENSEASATVKLRVDRTELSVDASDAYSVFDYPDEILDKNVTVGDVLEITEETLLFASYVNVNDEDGRSFISRDAVFDEAKKPYVSLAGSNDPLPADTVIDRSKDYVLHLNVALKAGMEKKWSIDKLKQEYNLVFDEAIATSVEVTYAEKSFIKKYDGTPFVLTPTVHVFMGEGDDKTEIKIPEGAETVVSKWYRPISGGNTTTMESLEFDPPHSHRSPFLRYKLEEMAARYQEVESDKVTEPGTYYHVVWFLDESGAYDQSFAAQRVVIESVQAVVMPVYDNGNSEAPQVIDETVTDPAKRILTVYSGQTVQSVLDRIGYKAFETGEGIAPDTSKALPEDAFGTAYDIDLTGSSTQVYQPVFAIQKRIRVEGDEKHAAYDRWVDADENNENGYYDDFIESDETYRIVFTGDKAVFVQRDMEVNGEFVYGWFEAGRIDINGAGLYYKVLTTEEVKDAWAITLIPADKKAGEIDVSEIVAGAAEAGFAAAAGSFAAPLTKKYKWNGAAEGTAPTGAEPIYATREEYKKAKITYHDVTTDPSSMEAKVTDKKNEVADITGTDERFEYNWYRLENEDLVLTQLLDKAREINPEADTLALTAPAEGADEKTKRVYEEWESIVEGAAWEKVNEVLNDDELINANEDDEEVDKDKAVAPFDAGVYRLGVKFNPKTMDDFKYDAPEAFVYYVVEREWAVAAIEPAAGIKVFTDGDNLSAGDVLFSLQNDDPTRSDSYISGVHFYASDEKGNRGAELGQPSRVNVLRDLMLDGENAVLSFEIDKLSGSNTLDVVPFDEKLSEKDQAGNKNNYRLNIRRIPDYKAFDAGSVSDYNFWTEEEKHTYPKLSNYNFGRVLGKHGEDLSEVKYPNGVIPVNVAYSDMIPVDIEVDDEALGLEKIYDGNAINLSQFIDEYVHVTRSDNGEELKDAKARLHVTLTRQRNQDGYPDPYVLPTDLSDWDDNEATDETTYTEPVYLMDNATRVVKGAVHGGVYSIDISLEGDASYRAARAETDKTFTVSKRELALIPVFRTQNDLVLTNNVKAKIPGIPAGIYATSDNISKYVVDKVVIDKVGTDADTGLVQADQSGSSQIFRAYAFEANKYDEQEKDPCLESKEKYIVKINAMDGSWGSREDAFLTAYNGGVAEPDGIPTYVSYAADYRITDKQDASKQTFVPVNSPSVIEEFISPDLDEEEVMLQDTITGVKDEATGMVAYTHNIIPLSGIPVDYLGVKSPDGSTKGKNVFRFRLHSPVELTYAGDRIVSSDDFRANYSYREGIKAAGGWLGSLTGMKWDESPVDGGEGITPYIKVNFLSAPLAADATPTYTFNVNWGKYSEEYVVDLTKAGNEDDLTKAVAPKSLKILKFNKKMAVGDTQQLDVQIKKKQKADIILLGYRIKAGDEYISITDSEAERYVSAVMGNEAGAFRKTTLPAGIVTALRTNNGKPAKATIEVFAAYYDEHGVKQPIINSKGKEACVAKVDITVGEVAKPSIGKITAGPTFADISYKKPVNGMRREAYVLKGKGIKEDQFEELIASVKNGNYESVFDYVQFFNPDAERENLSNDLLRQFTAWTEKGLDPEEDYTVYIRNVSGMRTVNDGDVVADSHAGVVKSFKTGKLMIDDLKVSMNAPAVEYDWTNKETYVPFADDNGKLGDHPYYDYSVKLSDGKVSASAMAKLWDIRQNPAADKGDYFLAPLKFTADLKKVYQEPKVVYVATDTAEADMKVYGPKADTFKNDVPKSEKKSYAKVKYADGSVAYIHKSPIATADKKGNVTLLGKGHVWIMAIDTVSKATDRTLLFIDATPTSMTPAKKVNVGVGNSVLVSELMTYSEGKKKIAEYGSWYEYYNEVYDYREGGHFYDLSFDPVESEDFLIEQIPAKSDNVKNCPVYADKRSDVRITALNPKAKLTLTVSDNSAPEPLSATINVQSIDSKGLLPVKGVKVLNVADDRATFGFSSPYNLLNDEATVRMIVKDAEGKVYTDELISGDRFDWHDMESFYDGVSLYDKAYDGFSGGEWYGDTCRYDGKNYNYAVSYVADSNSIGSTTYVPNHRDHLTRLSSYSVTFILQQEGLESKAVTKKFKTKDIPASYRGLVRGTDKLLPFVDGGVDGGIRVTSGKVQYDDARANYPELNAVTLRTGNDYTLCLPLDADSELDNISARIRKTDKLKWTSTNTKVAKLKVKPGTFEATLTAVAQGTSQIYVTSGITKKVIAAYTVKVVPVGDAGAYVGDNEAYERTADFFVSVLDEEPRLESGASEILNVSVGSLFNEPGWRETRWYRFTAPAFGFYSLTYLGRFVNGFRGIALEKGESRYFSITGTGADGFFRIVGNMGSEIAVGTGDSFTAVGENENVFFIAPEDGLYEIIYQYKDGHTPDPYLSDAKDPDGNPVGYKALEKDDRVGITIPEGVKGIKVIPFAWTELADAGKYSLSGHNEMKWLRFNAPEDNNYRFRFEVSAEDEAAGVQVLAFYGEDKTVLADIADRLNTMSDVKDAQISGTPFKNEDSVMIISNTDPYQGPAADIAGEPFALYKDAEYDDENGRTAHIYVAIQYTEPEEASKPINLTASVIKEKIDDKALASGSADMSATMYVPSVYNFVPQKTGTYVLDYTTGDNDENAPDGVELELYEGDDYPALDNEDGPLSWAVQHGKASVQEELYLEAGKTYHFRFSAVNPAVDTAVKDDKDKAISAKLTVKERSIPEIGLTPLPGNTVAIDSAGKTEYRYFVAPETNIYTFSMVRSEKEDAKNLGQGLITLYRYSTEGAPAGGIEDSINAAPDPAAEIVNSSAPIALKEGDVIYLKIRSEQRAVVVEDDENNDKYNRTIRVEKRTLADLPASITLNGDETKYFVFRPTGNDVYSIVFTRTDDVDATTEVRFSDDKTRHPYTYTEAYDDWFIINSKEAAPDGVGLSEIRFNAEGKRFFSFKNNSDKDAETIKVTVLKRDPADFTAGKQTKTLTAENDGVGAWFRFKPEKPGYYKVTFTGDKDKQFNVKRYRETGINSYPTLQADDSLWTYDSETKSASRRDFYVKAEPDVAYYFGITTEPLADNESLAVTATAELIPAQVLKAGETYTATTDKPFLLLSWTADEENVYSFRFSKDPEAATNLGRMSIMDGKYSYKGYDDYSVDESIYTYQVATEGEKVNRIFYVPVGGFTDDVKEIKVKLEEIYKPQKLTLKVPGTTEVKIAKGASASLSYYVSAEEEDFYSVMISSSNKKSDYTVTGVDGQQRTEEGLCYTGYQKWDAAKKRTITITNNSEEEVTYSVAVTRRVITELKDGQTIKVAKNTQQWFSYQAPAYNHYDLSFEDEAKTDTYKVESSNRKDVAVPYGNGIASSEGEVKFGGTFGKGSVEYYVVSAGKDSEGKDTDLSLTFKVKSGSTEALADGKEYTVAKTEYKVLTWTVDKDDVYKLTLTDTEEPEKIMIKHMDGAIANINSLHAPVANGDKFDYNYELPLKAGDEVLISIRPLDDEDRKVTAHVSSYWKDATEIKAGTAFEVKKKTAEETGTVYRLFKYQITNPGVADLVFTGEKGKDPLAEAFTYEGKPTEQASFSTGSEQALLPEDPEGEIEAKDKYYTYTFNGAQLNATDVIYFRAPAPADTAENLRFTLAQTAPDYAVEASTTIGKPIVAKDAEGNPMVYTWTNTSDKDVLLRVDAHSGDEKAILEAEDSDGSYLGRGLAWRYGTFSESVPVKAGQTAFLYPRTEDSIVINSIRTEDVLKVGKNSVTFPVGCTGKTYYVKNGQGMAGAGFYSASTDIEKANQILFDIDVMWYKHSLGEKLYGSDTEFIAVRVFTPGNLRLSGNVTITRNTGALVSDTAVNKEKHLYGGNNYIRVENTKYARAKYELTYEDPFGNPDTKGGAVGDCVVVHADGTVSDNAENAVRMGESLIFIIDNISTAYQTKLTVKKVN